jgi:hypothetical protein
MVLATPTGTTAAAETGCSAWSSADSAAHDGIDRWGDPSFSVSARGHVTVQPRGVRGGCLDLMKLVAASRACFPSSATSIAMWWSNWWTAAAAGLSAWRPEQGGAADRPVAAGRSRGPADLQRPQGPPLDRDGDDSSGSGPQREGWSNRRQRQRRQQSQAPD